MRPLFTLLSALSLLLCIALGGLWAMEPIDDYLPNAPQRYALSFEYSTQTLGNIRIPYAVVCLGLAILPTLWIFGRVKGLLTRRSETPCCSACGYDLRATPDRCPECGAVPTAPK